jgi:hypothetical protein
MVSRPVESKIPGTGGAGVLRLPSFCGILLAGKPTEVKVKVKSHGSADPIAANPTIVSLQRIRPGETVIYYTGGRIEDDISGSEETRNYQAVLLNLHLTAQSLAAQGRARLVVRETTMRNRRWVHEAIGI